MYLTKICLSNRIENTINPEFKKTFFITCKEEDKPCFVLIKILDEVYKQSYREMGQGIFDLRTIISANKSQEEKQTKLSKKLSNGGIINLHAVEAIGFDKLHLKFSGSDLVNARGRRKKCLPFYQFSLKNGKWVLLIRWDLMRLHYFIFLVLSKLITFLYFPYSVTAKEGKLYILLNRCRKTH